MIQNVDRDLVKHNSRLTLKEHQEYARSLVNKSTMTQAEVAEELGVTRVAVGKAVTQAGTRRLALQTRIVEHLTDFEVEKEVRIRYRKPSQTARGVK